MSRAFDQKGTQGLSRSTLFLNGTYSLPGTVGTAVHGPPIQTNDRRVCP